MLVEGSYTGQSSSSDQGGQLAGALRSEEQPARLLRTGMSSSFAYMPIR